MTQCTARSKRSLKRCLKWAIRGRSTCHMHGGTSNGSKTKAGRERSRKAALKHGAYTHRARAQRREALILIRQSKDVLKCFSE
jgi:hypothetical protein